MEKFCIDCQKLIAKDSIRCRSCSTKNKYKLGLFDFLKGESNPNYKHGKSICNKCIDCNKIIHPMATRCLSCSKKGKLNPLYKVSGPTHPTWIDGRSFVDYPIEFSNELKLRIRTRDGFECLNCGMTEEEHLIILGEVLNVHHIDYNKQNCEENNLATTCKWCNVRANFNRSYWQQSYNKKLEASYGKSTT